MTTYGGKPPTDEEDEDPSSTYGDLHRMETGRGIVVPEEHQWPRGAAQPRVQACKRPPPSQWRKTSSRRRGGAAAPSSGSAMDSGSSRDRMQRARVLLGRTLAAAPPLLPGKQAPPSTPLLHSSQRGMLRGGAARATVRELGGPPPLCFGSVVGAQAHDVVSTLLHYTGGVGGSGTPRLSTSVGEHNYKGDLGDELRGSRHGTRVWWLGHFLAKAGRT